MVRLHHMSWLDEQIKRSEELRTRAMLIDSHAQDTYDGLWNSLIGILDEAKEKFTDFGLNSHGGPKERKVEAIRRLTGERERQMTLKLEPNNRVITAFVGGGSIPFTIGICAVGVVCLTHEGHPITAQESSQIIMGYFLFPELTGKAPNASVYTTRGLA